MNTLFLESRHNDEQRRQQIFQGKIYLYAQRKPVMALAMFAQGMIEDAFGGRDPELAQHDMPVEAFEVLLNKLKPAFVNHPEAKRLVLALLADFGCDIERTYFDLPRMRSSTSGGYLTTGIAYAFDSHRDTWFSGPLGQINWWLPIYPVQEDNTMVFYPEYFSKHIENGSKGYDCHEWNRTSKLIQQGVIKEDNRKRPMPLEEVDERNRMVIIPEPGGMFVFSAAHLHASIPNRSGRTRYSIDFRTLHLDDARLHHGAPNVDNYCTGTIMRDFIHPHTHELLPADIIASYEQGTPVLSR